MKYLRWLVYLVVGAGALIVAVANKQMVQIHLNPLDTSGSNILSLAPMRLSMVIFLAMLIGFVLGGIFMWVRQRQFRKTARIMRDQAKAAQSEVQHLKKQVEGAGGKFPALS